jgi:hypothetical protein
MPGKAYLGDGVYVEIDDRGLVLTTENGIAVTNTIVLEAEVLDALLLYVHKLASRINADHIGR